MVAADQVVDLAKLSRGGPLLVGKLPHQPGGVDFLGLRQVNLALMQQLSIGIQKGPRIGVQKGPS
jgi:hypothetical protein